jgi:HAD superfamily hydrolase (TIGR01458 family)
MTEHGAAVPAVLLDLDGTLYSAGAPIPGAVEAVRALRARGHVLRFLTNTDSKSSAGLREELAGMGFLVGEDELFTPVTAAEVLLASTPGAVVLPLLAPGLRAGFARFEGNDPTHVVVGDVRLVLSYDLLDSAFRAVRRGAVLLALQKGRYFKAEDGDHLDTGAFVAALEFAAGIEATVLGKPAPQFLALAAASVGVRPDDVVVVGDDATTDMAMAAHAGAFAVQVRTGKFADQQAEGITSSADLVLDSVAGLTEALLARAASA